MLGNIYLHHVLDLWFGRDVRPRMRGKTLLVRYCDDFVIGFERTWERFNDLLKHHPLPPPKITVQIWAASP